MQNLEICMYTVFILIVTENNTVIKYFYSINTVRIIYRVEYKGNFDQAMLGHSAGTCSYIKFISCYKPCFFYLKFYIPY